MAPPLHLLSDHMPFTVQSAIVRVLSWNILFRMCFHQEREYFNNGFGCSNESESYYQNRLMHIMTHIARAAKRENMPFICLQECPSGQYFKAQLETLSTNSPYVALRGDRNNLVTLYDANQYAVDEALTVSAQSTELFGGLKERIIASVFLQKVTKKKILLINVHAKFNKPVVNDIEHFYLKMKALGVDDLLLVGDFNRDLTSASDTHSLHDVSEVLNQQNCLPNSLCAYRFPQSSFIALYERESQKVRIEVETRDGAIASFPLELSCMANINQAEDSLLREYPLSLFLQNLPPGFLAGLVFG